jgi:hypothetical protein
MANSLYEKARRGFLSGAIDWVSGKFGMLLLDTKHYRFNGAAHSVLADIPEDARIGQAMPLTGRCITDNACDADDIVFRDVTGPVIGASVIYLDTGDESTSTLIQYMDKGKGYPTTPNGADIKIIWDDGPFKIFTIPRN